MKAFAISGDTASDGCPGGLDVGMVDTSARCDICGRMFSLAKSFGSFEGFGNLASDGVSDWEFMSCAISENGKSEGEGLVGTAVSG